ncbi:hypothetical protein MferCBS31731_000474 [Microsporum ferrugineum]
MPIFIERRGSPSHGFRKRVLLSSKGVTQVLYDDMSAYGPYSDPEDMSDLDDVVNLSDYHPDPIRASQSSRVRIRISVSSQGRGSQSPNIHQRMGRSEMGYDMYEDNIMPGLRRKRSPSPTPSMTSTSSTEETIRPTRKKVNIMKPLKKFREIVPVVHVPEFKGKAAKPRSFREMSPRCKGDPIIITPKTGAAAGVKKDTTASPTNDKTKTVRFAPKTDGRDDPSSPLSGTAKRLS